MQQKSDAKMPNHLEQQSFDYATSGQAAGGSVASRSGSGSRSHTSGSTSASGRRPLPAVTVPHHHHHHHRIRLHHDPSLYAAPIDHHGHPCDRSSIAGSGGANPNEYYHHSPSSAAGAEDALLSAGGSGGGGSAAAAYGAYPPAQQQRRQHQHNEYGTTISNNPDQQHYYSHQSQIEEEHEAGAEFHHVDSQCQPMMGELLHQDTDGNATHGGGNIMYQKEAAAAAEGGDSTPTNNLTTIPTSTSHGGAVVEKIVAAATDVHQAVQYALQLGVEASSSPKIMDVANGNDNEDEGEVDDQEFHTAVDSDEDGGTMHADEAGERRRRRRERRRGEHSVGGGAWLTTIGGGSDDGAETGGDAIGGAGSTTYDRRRAARRVLRGLVALEETIEALSSSSMLAASMTHDNDSSLNLVGNDGDRRDYDADANNTSNNGFALAGNSALAGVGENGGGTNNSQLKSQGCRDENGNQDIERLEGDEGDFDTLEPSESINTATLTITLERLMVDLLMVPTEVRASLLGNKRATVDNDENNDDCGGVNEGGRSSNVGSNGIVRLLDESETIASRIVVQYLNKSTDQYLSLASLVPAQPLPPWSSVDGLLGRVFPQFVAVNGGKTYPTYQKTTAIILSLINTIGSVYAAQGLSMEIPAIDAFVLCHYLARRGLSDLTTTDASLAVLDVVDYGSSSANVQEDAALQLRKLIVRVLGRLLECLASARAGTSTCTFAGKSLLYCLVEESQRLQASGEHSGTVVSTNDVEDCMDVLSEYCTEIMEHALDSLDSFNALVKNAMSDHAKDDVGGGDHQTLGLGQTRISDAHVDGLRGSIRSVQIAVKSFSTLHQLGVSPEPSTLKSFVANLSDFWAISCNKLMNWIRKPLCDGGMTHHLAEDIQQSIDALGQQLIHISVLTRPRRAPISGRQRGGSKGPKRSSISKEERSAHFVALVNAVSKSQRGGGCDDLHALIHGFQKKSIGLETSQCQVMGSMLKYGDIDNCNAFNQETKRRRTKVSFEDDATMDEHVPSSHYCNHDEHDLDGTGKEATMFLLKKADEEGVANMNLVNACMLSSLLLPEFPSLATQGSSDSDEGDYDPNVSFEESYNTTAALVAEMSFQSGTEDNARSLVCDPTNPWHALIGRKITDTVSKRDASGIGMGGTNGGNATLPDARGVLLRHAGACQAVAL